MDYVHENSRYDDYESIKREYSKSNKRDYVLKEMYN
jgi:hypothetical protein